MAAGQLVKIAQSLPWVFTHWTVGEARQSLELKSDPSVMLSAALALLTDIEAMSQSPASVATAIRSGLPARERERANATTMAASASSIAGARMRKSNGIASPTNVRALMSVAM